MASLEQVGEELVGQARCPFESGQTNVGLFAGESGGRSERSRTSSENANAGWSSGSRPLNETLTFLRWRLLLGHHDGLPGQ